MRWKLDARPARTTSGVAAAVLIALVVGCGRGGPRPAAQAAHAAPPSPEVADAESRARALLADGKAQDAIDALTPLAATRRDDVTLQALLGQALFARARYDEAAEAYRLAAAADPSNAEVWRNLGLAQLQGSALVLGSYLELPDQLRDALASFSKAATLAPQDAEARYLQGYALAKLGDLAGAEARYDEALARKADHAAALREKGVLALKRGEAAAAADLLARAHAADPRDASAAYELGKALAAAGRDPEAESALRAALALDPLSREAHYQLALALARLGRDADSAAERTKFESLGTTEIDSQSVALASREGGAAANDPRFHAALALQHEEAGRVDDAIAEYRKALALDDTLSDVHLRVGVLLLEQGHAADAERDLARCVELAPDLETARLYLAGALEAQGRIPDALTQVQAAGRLAPGDWRAHRNLALLLARAGHPADAAREQALAEKLQANAGPAPGRTP